MFCILNYNKNHHRENYKLIELAAKLQRLPVIPKDRYKNNLSRNTVSSQAK